MAIGRSDAVRRSSVLSLYALLVWALLSSLAAAQDGPEYFILERDDGETFLEERQNYQFTGALAIYGSGGGAVQTSGSTQENPSGAVPAQCPGDHPVSCTSIQQPYYCCPSDNYCAWANSVVACCPNGKTCSGSVQGGGGAATSTYYQPSTTTAYAGGGYVAPAGTTIQTGGYNGYCSTLIAVGPGLPTTEQGECGTILIAEAEAIQAAVIKWSKLIAMLVGLQVVGGMMFLRR